jgi:hypothetical protein
MSQIVSIEHGVNPLVVTSVPHAVSTGLYPGGMIHAWFVAPGWSLHDKIYQVVMVSDTVPYSYRIMGADTTSDPVFTAGAIAGQLCPAWHLQNPDNFWPPTSPIWTDYVRDDTSPTTFDRFPNGQDVYNPLQDWWPAGEQALIVGGGAGSDSQITRAWKMERNPNYPATQTQPWRFVNWNLLNTGASAWVWRLHHNEGGKVVSNPGDVDYLYCAGGVTWNGSAYIVQRIFHRIRCSDGWVEKLPDLPANLPTSMYGMLSWDEKRHGLLYIGYRVYWFDLDAYRASPGTTTWLDITPYPIRNYTTNTGVYRPMSGSTGGYVRSLDAHFFRGTPKLDFAPVVSHGALINAPETTGTPERFTFARIQLPSTWIKE